MDSAIKPGTLPCFFFHTCAWTTSLSLQTKPMPKSWQLRSSLRCCSKQPQVKVKLSVIPKLCFMLCHIIWSFWGPLRHPCRFRVVSRSLSFTLEWKGLCQSQEKPESSNSLATPPSSHHPYRKWGNRQENPHSCTQHRRIFLRLSHKA